MDDIATEGPNQFEMLMLSSIPKDVFMALEDAYRDGDKKGRASAADFAAGHRASAVGGNRHFALNEAFHTAFTVHGGNPSPLKGNKVVTARFGIFNIARLNVPGHKWVDLRRSKTREKLAEVNLSLQRRYVQGDLFAKQPGNVLNATLFILGVMNGLDSNGVSQLTNVMVAAPAPNMESWLYVMPLSRILALYDIPEQPKQLDNAKPVLKGIAHKKQSGDDQRNQ
jgi:hypothetical protein